MTKPPGVPASKREHLHAPANVAGTGHLPAQIRQARLVEMVRDRGFLSVTGGAAEFNVSVMTIRRDLDELEQAGRVIRTHGGARALEDTANYIIDQEEPAFEARLRQNRDAKERIAMAAVELVEGKRTAALDVGTTTHLLAMRLASRANLKVFTNSLRNAMLLSGGPGSVYTPGGHVVGDEMSVGGPMAVEQFGKMWFDVAFIGVSGVTAAGFFDYSLEDSEMKRVYLDRSECKVVLCDAMKFRRMSLVRIAELTEVNLLLTDAEPPPDLAAALAAAGVEVRIAPAPSGRTSPGNPVPPVGATK